MVNPGPIYFPDPNLEAVIRQAIGKPTGDIYESDVSSLAGLSAADCDIADLTGLEHCTSLRYLGLSNSNQISDIQPLVNHPGVGSGDVVYLEMNPLSSTSLITWITQLQGRGAEVHYT
jgi:hypothetical protein